MMKNSFVVITRTRFEQKYLNEVLKLVNDSVPIFKKQPGLQSLTFLVSHDKTETSTIMVWNSKTDHEKCMVSPDFKHVNLEWQNMMNEEKIKFDLQTYEQQQI